MSAPERLNTESTFSSYVIAQGVETGAIQAVQLSLDRAFYVYDPGIQEPTTRTHYEAFTAIEASTLALRAAGFGMSGADEAFPDANSTEQAHAAYARMRLGDSQQAARTIIHAFRLGILSKDNQAVGLKVPPQQLEALHAAIGLAPHKASLQSELLKLQTQYGTSDVAVLAAHLYSQLQLPQPEVPIRHLKDIADSSLHQPEAPKPRARHLETRMLEPAEVIDTLNSQPRQPGRMRVLWNNAVLHTNLGSSALRNEEAVVMARVLGFTLQEMQRQSGRNTAYILPRLKQAGEKTGYTLSPGLFTLRLAQQGLLHINAAAYPRQELHFSPEEQRLAALHLADRTLDEIARLESTKTDAVRAQLQGLHRKIGANTEAEFALSAICAGLIEWPYDKVKLTVLPGAAKVPIPPRFSEAKFKGNTIHFANGIFETNYPETLRAKALGIKCLNLLALGNSNSQVANHLHVESSYLKFLTKRTRQYFDIPKDHKAMLETFFARGWNTLKTPIPISEIKLRTSQFKLWRAIVETSDLEELKRHDDPGFAISSLGSQTVDLYTRLGAADKNGLRSLAYGLNIIGRWPV